MAFSIGTILYEAHEMWAIHGAPVETYAQASPYWAMLQKRFTKLTHGRGPHRLPLTLTSGAYGGGTSIKYSSDRSVGGGGLHMDVPPAAFHEMVCWSQYDVATLGSGDTKSGLSAVQKRMALTATRAHKGASVQVWGNGSGMHAKGNGVAFATTDVAGDTIVLKNFSDARKFPTGTRVILASVTNYDAHTPGTLVDPTRAFASIDEDNINGYLQVINSSETTGKLVFHTTITNAVPTADPLDWLGLAGEFKQETIFRDDASGMPVYAVPLHGFFAYNPLTDTQASKDLYGLKRSRFLDETTGVRVKLDSSGLSPYEIISKMTAAAVRRITNPRPGAKFCIYVPVAETERLTEDFGSRSITVVNMAMGGSAADYSKTNSLGCKGYVIQMPNFPELAVIADPYLTDSEVTVEEDRTYVMLDEDACVVSTSPVGYGWVDATKSGSFLKQRTGDSTDILAQYGGFGGHFNKAPGHTILTSTRARS